MTTTTRTDKTAQHFDENAQHIAKRQYLQPSDGDISGMFWRIADWVASAEAPETRLKWAQEYYDLMAEKKFCPGGRVLAGAGTQHGNVLNCLQGDTLVETRDGQARIADLRGEVEVLSAGGVYRKATFGSYGRQELYRVLLSNGETLEATAGHQWPVGRLMRGQYRKLTTLELPGHDLPVIATGLRPERNADFDAGVQHGVVYGDGSKNTNGHTHHVQLFGQKRALAQHFDGHRVHDAVYSGREVTVAQGMRGELKALPDEFASDSYWYGFFCGLLATDGGVDDRGSAAIYQSDAEELNRLAARLGRFGVKAASINLFRQADGGYGGKPAFALRLIKQTLLADDFLREDQRNRFVASSAGQTRPRNASLRVVAVEPTGRSEEVFCCDEPQTHTFVIAGGILTGNCFVQGATEHAPSSFEGVMEVAKKLALVTKVGGGNGVNLDVYTPRAKSSRSDNGVRGWVYMSATHADVQDFIEGLMRPPTQPDGEKQPVAVRNWTRVVYGQAISPELVASARANGVQIVRTLPEGVQTVPDDMGGIVDAARLVAETAKLGVEPRLDLSQMREEGAPIKGSGGTSSGPVSFLLEIFDNFLEWANRGAEQSGPINTLRYVYAPVLRVVRQGGTRRGAGMATISIAHPDVLDFLTAKDLDREAAEGDISTFNISILVDTRFWDTLQAGGLWPIDAQDVPGKYYLAPQTGEYGGNSPELPDRAEDGAKGVPVYGGAIPAQWLWDQIAQHAWSTGEPGLIFNDRVNEYSALKNLGKRYEIRSTNPCGEIPLTIGEPCDLGAINLAAYVENSNFNYQLFRQDVRTCVRFLDDVLDVNVFALEDNRVASQDLRRLGLGVMGLADALIKMGLRYDNEAGRKAIYDIMSALREEAVAESERLGQERGIYAVYERNEGKIPHEPRRNVAVLTVAPTGTTSMLMGVSSGIEPVFSPFIWRKIGSEYRALLAPLFVELLESYPAPKGMEKDGGWDWDKVTEAVSENHGSVMGLSFIPEPIQQVFVCAHDISPVDHVRMQGTVQRAFDDGGQHAANSLSKTINLPNSATIQDVQDAYAEAYKTGCKGITVYRDGSRQFQVLSTSKKKAKTEEAQETPASESVSPQAPAVPAPGSARPQYERPARLSGITDMVKLTDPTSGHRRSFLVTVNQLGGKPVEVMVISGRAGDEANADSEALGRVVSIALQHGVPAQALVHTLRGINGGLYGSYNGRLVGSKADLIAVALDTFQKDMEDAAQLPPLAGGSGESRAVAAEPAAHGVSTDGMQKEKCPVCEARAVIREEGCLKCQACGYSKCG